MLLAGAVTSSNTLSATDAVAPEALDWVTLVFAVVTVHCLLLGLGWMISQWAGFPYTEKLAVSIAGSQKTLPVGLEVAALIGGLAVLPMIVYHVTQLLIDTLLIEHLRGYRSQLEPPEIERATNRVG
jgi:sodium/bile acid cotransporter 7